jgi:hypothetical protein
MGLPYGIIYYNPNKLAFLKQLATEPAHQKYICHLSASSCEIASPAAYILGYY